MRNLLCLLWLCCFVMLNSALAHAQTIQITGTVTDTQDNSPMPGVSIVIKGTSNGAVTDAQGKYAIAIKDQNTVLTFQAIGYQTIEIKVGNRSVIDVKMSQSSATLSEVVVMGGAREKRVNTKDHRREPRTKPAREGYKKIEVARPTQAATPPIKIKGSPTAGGENKPKRDTTQPNTEPELSTEEYGVIVENGFATPQQSPLSTFSIDVDKAAYATVRRFLREGSMPPPDAVRVEEMLNYFKYNYPQPTGSQPYSINTEIAQAPWNPQHQLVSVSLQGRIIADDAIPASNLVFLIDVSGSMSYENKLPLVKQAFELLVSKLRPRDRVSIVVYAGAAGLVLPPTPGNDRETILNALNQLQAGGSTAGGAGIQLAYKTAQENFLPYGNNRVIIATDGDFNVGASSDGDLVKLIEEKRQSGVFLTCLGFGMGNYKDSKMELLADKGNGNYAYIDDANEAKRVLVREFGGTLFTIAKDVKLQVEFNPALVQAYRLIGYENRTLAAEDFKDDSKDAGEMGAGHCVTALYEIIPVGVRSSFVRKTDALKYQTNAPAPDKQNAQEWLTVKTRYKEPKEGSSQEITKVLAGKPSPFAQASANLRFAASVASFAMLLRDSKYKGETNYQQVVAWAGNALDINVENERSEFITLVERAAQLKGGKAVAEK